MKTLLSLLWKILPSAAALLGLAATARTDAPTPDGRTAQAGFSVSAAPADPGRWVPGTTIRPAPGSPLLPGWNRPLPERIPRPTYWPMILALGVTFFLWGVISNLFVLGLGLALLVGAAIGWIGDMFNAAQ